MVIRVSIANLDVAEAARIGQASGFAGTIFPSVGFGSWGVEHGVTFEFALPIIQAVEPFRAWVEATLTARKEQAAYVTADGGRARLWHADGREEIL